jgi:hypothetical protein
MSKMSMKDIDEIEEALRLEPNWCLNCRKDTPDHVHLCSKECAEDWDRKMNKWCRDLQIENLIHEKDPFIDREHEKVNNLRTGTTLPLGK